MNAQLRAAQPVEESGLFADMDSFVTFLEKDEAVADTCRDIIAEFACALYRDEYAVRKLERRFRELAYECIRDAEKSEAA